jgi:vacuolar-type H+-ATPase subunit H
VSDYTVTILLGIIAAAVAFLIKDPGAKRATKKAHKRADQLADEKAEIQKEQAEESHEKAVNLAHSQTQRIDAADLHDLADMVNYEFGSD